MANAEPGRRLAGRGICGRGNGAFQSDNGRDKGDGVMSDDQRLMIIGIVLAVFLTLAITILYAWG